MESLENDAAIHNGGSIPDLASPKKGVRKPPDGGHAHPGCQDPTEPPAHPSNCLIAQLNANWRVVDDPLQWILQRRKGTPREKSTGWQGRSFCRTREGLLRCIREYCCLPDQGGSRCVHEYRGVDAAALQHVRALPEWHIDWEPLSAVELGHDAPFLAFAADEMVQ